MADINGEMIKRVLPIFYVIDTSGSMTGEKIATVNDAMRECEGVLKEKADEEPGVKVKIGALQFDSDVQWITKRGLVSLEDFHWNDVQAGGVTSLGAAINELESKLSRETGVLGSETGCFIPVIIFMTDGQPNDAWQKALKNANADNKWFKEARKVAIAIGSDADKDVLYEVVGSNEAVIEVNDLETLKKMIVAVSASASMLAGKSRMTGDMADGTAIAKTAVNAVNGVAKSKVYPVTPTTTSTNIAPDPNNTWSGGDDDNIGWK